LCSIDFFEINPKKKDEAEILYLLCKRGLIKDNIDKYYEFKQSVNRYTVGALLRTGSVASVVRRELRKMNPGIKVSVEELEEMIGSEVLKREVIGGDSGEEARKQVAKFYRNQSRAKNKKTKVNSQSKSTEKDVESVD